MPEPPYCYDHPRPAVAVDLAVFGLRVNELRILLIRRKADPFAGRWALPGGFLDIDEPIEAAARRELEEETGLAQVGAVEPIGVFGDPGRDPRGRVLSLAHGALIRGPLPEVSGRDDAAEAAWQDPSHAGPLAFDHDEVLARALSWLAQGVKRGPLGLALLPAEFDFEDVKRMLHATIGRPSTRYARAWLRRMEREGLVDEAKGGRGRSRVVGA